MMTASWAWCTDGRHRHIHDLVQGMTHNSHLEELSVLATPWLYSAHRQQASGTTRQMGHDP